jgi:prepilin peptidase CpaA
MFIVAWRDIATRTIPDMLSVTILVIGCIARAVHGPSAVVVSLAIALCVFALLLFAFARGFIGGGDVKIITAIVIGLSPVETFRFITATALAGGLLAGAYLLLSCYRQTLPKCKQSSLVTRILTIEAWRMRRRKSLPYGVAIAAGSATLLLHPGGL